MKGVVLLAAGVLAAIALVVFTPVVVEEWYIRAPVFAAAIGGIALLNWFDSRRETQEKKRATEGREERFRELCALAAAPQFELNVNGSSMLHFGATIIFFGAVMLFWGCTGKGIDCVLSSGAALAIGLLSLMWTLPTLGKPQISITKLGFKTPLTPFVPWKAVQGIDLQKLQSRGILIAHVLEFLIPSLPPVISRCSPLVRLANRVRMSTTGRLRLRVVLRNAREPPEVLHRFIRHLWTASTGNTHVRVPGMSDAFNEAMRRMEEAEARFLKEALAGPSARNKARDEEIAKTWDEAYAIVEAEM